jgi:hypothetical protein
MAARNQRIGELAEIEFANNRDITEFCRRGQHLAHDLAVELTLAARTLEANLAHVRGIPIINRTKARLVAKPLYFAAAQAQVLGEAIIRTRAAFLRYYAPELDQFKGRGRPRHTFEIVEE